MFSDSLGTSALLSAVLPPAALNVLALVLTLIGCTLVFTRWRQKGQKQSLRLLVGWLFVLAASYLWIITHGWEFGFSYFCIVIAFVAWTVVAINAQITPFKQIKFASNPKNPNLKPKKQATTKLANTGLVLSVLLLGGFASLLFTLELGLMLPFARPGQLVFSALAFPVIWAIVAIFLCYTNKLARMSLSLVLLSLIPAWHLLS